MAQATKATEKPFRGVSFTSFSTVPDWDTVKGHLRYLAYAKEICPTTQREHYQGFAYAFKSQRFSAFLKLFPKAHIEKMQGNFRENECYCSKEGTLTEFGVSVRVPACSVLLLYYPPV